MADIFRDASLSNEQDRDLLAMHPEFLELGPETPGSASLVATRAGRILGFARAAAGPGGDFELVDLFVQPKEMRSGVGRALVEAVAAEAKRRGYDHLHVDANQHALGFYQGVGFEVVHLVKLEFGTAWRMVKPLSR